MYNIRFCSIFWFCQSCLGLLGVMGDATEGGSGVSQSPKYDTIGERVTWNNELRLQDE